MDGTDAPLGLERGIVRLAPHHAEWATLFAREADRMRAILDARGLHLRFEHVGSTAVPGLAAKPIIDVLAGSSVEADRPRLIDALEAAGYVYRGEQGIPGRDFFRLGDPRRYHVHMTAIDSPTWIDHLLFRDVLRAEPAIAAEYSALKHELARRFPNDRPSYIEGKTEFVRRVLAAAQVR